MQYISDMVEQPRLVSPAARFQINAGEALNYLLLHALAICGQVVEASAVTLLVAAQINIREAALALQCMDQTADAANQFAGQLQTA